MERLTGILLLLLQVFATNGVSNYNHPVELVKLLTTFENGCMRTDLDEYLTLCQKHYRIHTEELKNLTGWALRSK